MSETTTAVAEASVAAVGSKATLGGGATSAAGFFFGFDPVGWVGLIIAFLGLTVNLYFSYQRDKREKEAQRIKNEREAELHELKKKKLTEVCDAEQD